MALMNLHKVAGIAINKVAMLISGLVFTGAIIVVAVSWGTYRWFYWIGCQPGFNRAVDHSRIQHHDWYSCHDAVKNQIIQTRCTVTYH